MRIDKYLLINSRGNVIIREREPRAAGNEIVLRLKLEVPDGFFKRPFLFAEMKIPNDAVPKGTITTEITDNLEKMVKEATGLEMRVSVVEHESEDLKN